MQHPQKFVRIDVVDADHLMVAFDVLTAEESAEVLGHTEERLKRCGKRDP